MDSNIRLAKLAKHLGNSRSLGEAMRKAGYSEIYSLNPQQIKRTKGYKEVIEPMINQLKKERERIMQEMSIRDISQEKYKELADVLDKFTKNIQLMEGKPTEITQHEELSHLDDSELHRIAEGSEEDASQEGASEETS